MFLQVDQVQNQRRHAETAIQLARASRWQDAVAANRKIISVFPNDVDSYNRLGKALMELGRLSAAKKAYKQALALDANNRIATKNLARLITLMKSGDGQVENSQADPSLFIEEIGKSIVTTISVSQSDLLSRLNAGDLVELQQQDNTLIVATPRGDQIGQVETKLGLRLMKLIEGGNRYAAGVTSVADGECRIIIKETYQDPSQANRPSFPTASATVRPRAYTKRSLVHEDGTKPDARSSASGDPAEADSETENLADDSPGSGKGDVNLYDAAAAEERAEEDEELEE